MAYSRGFLMLQLSEKRRVALGSSGTGVFHSSPKRSCNSSPMTQVVGKLMSPLKPPLDCSDEDIIVPPSEPTLSPVSPMCVSDLLCGELRPVQQILTDSDFDLDLENKPSLSTSFNPFDSSSSSLSSESCNPFDSSSSFSKPESCNSFNSSSSSSASGNTSSSLKAPSLFDYNKTYNFPSSPNDEQSAETNVSS